MKKALIISLSPHIGHVSHVVAYYKLFEELGYDSTVYLSAAIVDHLPSGIKYLTAVNRLNEYEVVLIYSPSKGNFGEMIRIKRENNNCQVLYVYHEPLSSKKSFRDAGVSWLKTQKIFLLDMANWLMVMLAKKVLLPSEAALRNYRNGIYKRLNKKYYYFPLIFNDERGENFTQCERKYFSYIGTIAADHAFQNYLNFVQWAVKNNRVNKLHFLIATKSEFVVPRSLEESSRVFIQKGRPLSNDEINNYYASSGVVWNAYSRTTQSGVLAKSFMFGTPAIILRKNLSEFTEDGKEVVAIDDNTSFDEIEKAVLRITESFSSFSTAARKRFEETFYYRKYNETFKKILLSL